MKKEYIKPDMKEVKLRSRYRLLVGSDEPKRYGLLRQISGHFPEFVANLAFCRKHFNKKVRKKLE